MLPAVLYKCKNVDNFLLIIVANVKIWLIFALYLKRNTMSSYYNIEGKKVRVSDHEPNTKLNGSNDLYIWTKDATGQTLSVGGQIDRFIDKYDMELKSFEPIIRDFADSDEECMYMLMEIERGK